MDRAWQCRRHLLRKECAPFSNSLPCRCLSSPEGVDGPCPRTTIQLGILTSVLSCAEWGGDDIVDFLLLWAAKSNYNL